MRGSHIQQQPPRRDPHQRAWRDQRTLSIACSACLHTLLLLLLSLIAMGAPADGPQQLLKMVDAHSLQAPLEQLPVFELALPNPPPAALPMAAPASIKLAIDLPTLKPTLGSAEQPPTAETAPQPPAANSLSSASDQRLLQAQEAIQSRVGQAGGKQGEVQFALAWKNINDVDLHVITPAGERISHLYRRSRCRGMLDVDMNVDGESTQPVENVRWITQAPWGRYTVLVNLFQIHRPTSPGGRVSRGSRFELLAKLGPETQLHSDTVAPGRQVAVLRFLYVAEQVGSPQREQMLAELAELQVQEERLAQPLFAQAKQVTEQAQRDRLLNQLIGLYPHTDSAIEAMQLLGGSITKR